MKQVIAFRIENELKEKIKAVAKKLGLRTADFCRYIILRKIEEVTTDAH